jgi:hypothetical protein
MKGRVPSIGSRWLSSCTRRAYFGVFVPYTPHFAHTSTHHGLAVASKQTKHMYLRGVHPFSLPTLLSGGQARHLCGPSVEPYMSISVLHRALTQAHTPQHNLHLLHIVPRQYRGSGARSVRLWVAGGGSDNGRFGKRGPLCSVDALYSEEETVTVSG